MLKATARAQLARTKVPAIGWFVPRGDVTYVDKGIALAGLFVLLMLNIAFPVWKIAPAVPVRGLFAGALLVALGTLYPAHAARAFRENGQLLGLVAGLALIGIFVSAVNGLAPGAIAQAVIEMHVQAAVMILVAFIVAYICGARACMLVIIGAVALSGLAAILQAAGVDAAWDIRGWLSGLQHQEVLLDTDKRPFGLSFSPIQLATQLCLAFAVFTAVRDKQRRHRHGVVDADPAVLPALLVFFMVSVASGNRSPVLGALLFFAFYAVQRRGTWLSFLIMIGGLAAYMLGPMILDMIQSTQPRMVQTGDKSATGRMSLFTFGLILFRDNPLGYGLAFSPTDHWTDYWHYLYTLPSAVVVQTRELHNYALNMLNTYGIGLLLLVPTAFGLLRRGKASLLFFIPYVVHIAFHNSGPLWNDMIIWFVVAAISVAGQNLPVDQRHERVGARGRRRYYSQRPGPHPRPYPG